MSSIFLNVISLNALDLYPKESVIQLQEEMKASPDFFSIQQKKKNLLISQAIVRRIQTHFEVTSYKTTEIVLQYALKIHRIRWKKTENTNIEMLQKIVDAMRQALHYSSNGVYFEPREANEQRLILDFLISRNTKFPKKSIWKNAKSLLLEKDPEFFKGFHEEWKKAMRDLFSQIKSEYPLCPLIIKKFIGNLISLLPYIYPEEDMELQIPMESHDTWELVSYKIDRKFSLTPEWYSSPLPAYGLIPKDTSNFPAIMTFQGSTFPSGDGFFAAIFSDFFPLLSVGRLPYLLGKDQLKEWLQDKRDVQAYGVSLGGSVAMHVIRELSQHFGQAYIFNPPGFYPWENKVIEGVEVHLISQWNDLVSTTGFFPKGGNVHIYRAVVEEQRNFIEAHNCAFSGSKKVTYIKTTSEHENKKLSRILFTGLHIVTPFVFFPAYILRLMYRLAIRIFKT